MSHPRALAQLKAPNRQAAWGVGISTGLALASARGGQASTANSQQCQQSHSKRKVQFSSCLLNVQTEVQISSKPTHQQCWDGESSPTESLSHQVLDHQRQPRATRYWCTSGGVICHLCFSSTQRSPTGARLASVMPLFIINPSTKH